MTYTNVNAPCMFLFSDKNFFMAFTRISVFVGHKPKTVTCFMHPKILHCILDDLLHIILMKFSGSR